MAETNTLITEEDIQKQRELVSRLEKNMQSLQARLPESSAHIESLSKQVESAQEAIEAEQKPVAPVGPEVRFEEKITLMPKMYDDLRKKYQMIENDPQVRILQDEVRKAELDTVYGPNPDFDKKSKELESLLKSNQATLEELKTRMASYRPIEISQLDRILNRYRDAEINPEDMYYEDYENDRDFLEQLANQYFPEVNQEQKSDEVVLMEQEQAKLQVQRDILADEVRKAELDTVYGPNPDFDKKSKELEKIDNQLKELGDRIKVSRQVTPRENSVDRMRKQYHDLRVRVERARDDADDMYPEFDKEEKLLHEIERAAFLHYNHRDKEINVAPVTTPEPPAPPAASGSNDVDLEEQLNKAKEEHNKLIGDVNKARADFDEAKDKLDELISKKAEQDKNQKPPVNPFENPEDASIKATRWECTYQGYAKTKLVKLATSTAFGKKIYDKLRAKRAEKYAKKLNRLQEVYDVSNANYNRIEGNYNRISNEIQDMQTLMDQKLAFEQLQLKVRNEEKTLQTLMRNRVTLFKGALNLLNVPAEQQAKMSEADVRKLLEQRTDDAANKMLAQLKQSAKLTNSGILAMNKDKKALSDAQNKYHHGLEEHGFDPTADPRELEDSIMTRLDSAKEEEQNFDYSQLESLASERLRAEDKLNNFMAYVQDSGATITPVEVELDPDELSERDVKSSSPKPNRFAVWFDGLKQRFSRNKDEELAEEAFENAGEVDEEEEKLAASAFENAGELDNEPAKVSPVDGSITDENKATPQPDEQQEEQDFSIPLPTVENSKAPVGLPVEPPEVSIHAPQHPERIRVVRPQKKNSEESTIAPDLQKAILGSEESRLQSRADKFEKDSTRVDPIQTTVDTTKTNLIGQENPMVSEEEAARILKEQGIDYYTELSPGAQQSARQLYARIASTEDSSKTNDSGKHM